MEAAREVGGDFYDFFLLGDDCGPESGKLAFVVADVSGKGVPASLFMMKAKAQIRDFLSSGLELGEALENANAQLCDGNDAGMFVTAWIGVLDYGTGWVEYVNAGHNPPLLWHADGEWEWVKQRGGVPLGLFDESPYKAHELECKDGDKLLLYTDGVTEAMDVDEALYGEDRLMALVQGEVDLPARELVEAVYGDVKSYATGAEQSDDITILSLGVGVPPEVTAELAVPARLGEMERVVDFVDEELEKRLCPVRVRHQVAIAVEELFVNVAHYAYPEATEDNPGNVLIRRTYSTNPNTISIDIIDSGIPFDPTAKADPAKPTSVEDVPIGGLGIFMVKKTMDEMLYVRESGTNVVTIIKHW